MYNFLKKAENFLWAAAELPFKIWSKILGTSNTGIILVFAMLTGFWWYFPLALFASALNNFND